VNSYPLKSSMSILSRRRGVNVLSAFAVAVAAILIGWAALAWLMPANSRKADRQSTCTLPTGSVTYQELQCHPEANLIYPGSTVFQGIGASQTNTFDGINPAFSGAILISSDPVTKIYAWYDSWLKQHEWYRSPLLGAGYVSSHGYARVGGREAFDVDIDNPAQLSATLGKKVPAGGTIFEVVYLVFPYTAGAKSAPSCASTPPPTGPLDSFYCNP